MRRIYLSRLCPDIERLFEGKDKACTARITFTLEPMGTGDLYYVKETQVKYVEGHRRQVESESAGYRRYKSIVERNPSDITDREERTVAMHYMDICRKFMDSVARNTECESLLQQAAQATKMLKLAIAMKYNKDMFVLDGVSIPFMESYTPAKSMDGRTIIRPRSVLDCIDLYTERLKDYMEPTNASANRRKSMKDTMDTLGQYISMAKEISLAGSPDDHIPVMLTYNQVTGMDRRIFHLPMRPNTNWTLTDSLTVILVCNGINLDNGLDEIDCGKVQHVMDVLGRLTVAETLASSEFADSVSTTSRTTTLADYKRIVLPWFSKVAAQDKGDK